MCYAEDPSIECHHTWPVLVVVRWRDTESTGRSHADRCRSSRNDEIARLVRARDLLRGEIVHDRLAKDVPSSLGKRREPLAWWVPAARLSLRGLTGLLNPWVKSGTRLFQPYFMNCFNCASPAGVMNSRRRIWIAMWPSRGGSCPCNGGTLPRFDRAVCGFFTVGDNQI